MVTLGTREIKIAFLQGLMDSEGWIGCVLSSMGRSYVNLSFGVTATWCEGVRAMFSDVGIETSRLFLREWDVESNPGKTPRKDFHYFSINLIHYVDAGMGFNIKRKQDRLDYCYQLLRDFALLYPPLR